MAGTFVLFHSAVNCRGGRGKSVLQPVLRKRASFWPAGRKIGLFSEKGCAGLDEEQGLPLWISGIFSAYVSADALEYLAGIFWRAGFESGRDTFVDVQTAVALGLQRPGAGYMDCPVCLWILQRYADLNDPGAYHYAAL